MATTSVTALTPDETAKAGEALGRTLGPGDVVALDGELGAGKTCFVQGLVRALGVVTQATSPTFVLVNEYRGRLPVHHVDAYRTGSLAELLDLGLLDLMGGDGVTLLEWAERAEPLLPRPVLRSVHEAPADPASAPSLVDDQPAELRAGIAREQMKRTDMHPADHTVAVRVGDQDDAVHAVPSLRQSPLDVLGR